jgi:hypothetical protein
MSVPTKPAPYVPIRRSGWPTRRMPLWGLLALLVVAGGVVLVSLSTRPSHSQQAADFTAYLHDMNADIESCAGGVSESEQAYTAVESNAQGADLATAKKMLTYNAANCQPATNELLADLTQYQVTESLANYNLDQAANDYVTWAFPDAMQVQDDMLAVLSAPSAAARSTALATLGKDQRTMNAERATINAILGYAAHAVSVGNAPIPSLPG